ncbi:acyl-CoA dehydrogenase family protein [Streptomyces sp. NPDC001978]|uniref:acyl-CoA dehydrogenase family protein n=1 Tax=Streptomyces sp. NPDC001978 TaxID=3364627 RepID=UPI00369C0DEB
MPDAAAVALAAECLGGAQYVMESAVEYAKTRIQFGRAIGSFQAIKHKCADMLLSVEAARSALWYARAASTTEDVTLMRLASSRAKATCGEAYMHCAAGNIQVHGALGSFGRIPPTSSISARVRTASCSVRLASTVLGSPTCSISRPEQVSPTVLVTGRVQSCRHSRGRSS